MAGEQNSKQQTEWQGRKLRAQAFTCKYKAEKANWGWDQASKCQNPPPVKHLLQQGLASKTSLNSTINWSQLFKSWILWRTVLNQTSTVCLMVSELCLPLFCLFVLFLKSALATPRMRTASGMPHGGNRISIRISLIQPRDNQSPH